MKTHNTIENAVALAEKITAKYNVTMQEAMDLAEFNLNYSESFQEAVGRV